MYDREDQQAHPVPSSGTSVYPENDHACDHRVHLTAAQLHELASHPWAQLRCTVMRHYGD
jgi:hypothetical protein